MQHLSDRFTRRHFGRVMGVLALGGAALAVAQFPLRSSAASILPPPPNPIPPQADLGGITLVGEGVAIPQPVARSAAAADRIALATVTGIGPSFWSTPNGQRPSGVTPDNPQSLRTLQATIYTPISVQVTQGIKHAAAGDRLTFVTPGGKVGPDLYTVQSEPRYQVSETLLLLLDAPHVLDGEQRTGVTVRDVFRVTTQGRALGLYYPADFNLQDTLAQIMTTVGS